MCVCLVSLQMEKKMNGEKNETEILKIRNESKENQN